MTKTFKILSAISFISLAIVLTFVGVWALTDLDFTVGGNITYTAPEPESTTPEDVPYLTFEYNSTTLTAKLTACSTSAPETVEIPEKIKMDNETYSVTSISVNKTYDIDEGEYIYSSIFENCTNTKSIIVPGTIINIDNRTFLYCTNLTSVTLSSGVTSIGDYAFQGCTGLASITIPDSVTSIWGNAFNSCTSLLSIEIPNGVEHIYHATFFSCTSLASITIPASVTSIYGSAFDSCTSLAVVVVKATTPPEVDRNIFSSCHADLQIKVPTASVSAYKSATYWSDYNIVDGGF